MKPKLKVNHIDNLHDARYCAAVGIRLLSFDLNIESDRRLEPAKVAEMNEWLAGTASIGEFGYDRIATILEQAEELKLDYISLPADYADLYLEDVEQALIFRSTHEPSPEQLALLLEKAANFPEALLDIRWEMEDAAELQPFEEAGVVQRSIFTFADPDPIYQLLEKAGTQAFGFSLGEFFEEPGGALDYQKCDDFLEEFEAVTA